MRYVLLLLLAGCGARTEPCEGSPATSSLVDFHVHDLCVPVGTLTDEPTSSSTLRSSVVVGPSLLGSHAHTITLEPFHIQRLKEGESVTLTTSKELNHTHTPSRSARSGSRCRGRVDRQVKCP